MWLPSPCSWIVLACCVSASQDSRGGKLEPRLCERMPLTGGHTEQQSTAPLRNLARELAQRLLLFDAAIEHGALFYRTFNGGIRIGAIASGDASTVQLTVDTRQGETIIGALHTHARFPYHTGDQSRLSHEDIELAERLLALPMTDNALMLYIVDVNNTVLTEYAAHGHCTEQSRSTVA
jgi:hypothetical protein